MQFFSKSSFVVFSCMASFIAFPVHAQDICSADGKSRLRSASVTEAQISRLCPVAAGGGATPSIDYRTSKAALVDGSAAIGKVLQLDGRPSTVSTDFLGKTYMTVWLEDTFWEVYFDSGQKNSILGLADHQPVSVICRIKDINPRHCVLLKMTAR